MRIFFSMFSILFICTQLVGQVKTRKAKINIGMESKEKRLLNVNDVVCSDDDGIYVVKQMGKVIINGFNFSNPNSSIELHRYSHSMNPSNSNKIELEYEGKKMNYEHMVQLGEEIYLFASFRNKKIKKNLLFACTINKKTLAMNKDLRLISEIDFSGYSRFNPGAYSFEISQDRSKLLIYYDRPSKKKEFEKFGFQVFDSQVNEIWSENVTLPYEEKLVDLEDVEVDNDGNFHILALIFKEKRKEKTKAGANYRFEILSYLDQGSSVKEFPMSMNNKFLTEMNIEINDKNELICGGFYAENDGFYGNENGFFWNGATDFKVSGSYYVRMDSRTGEVYAYQANPFDFEFLTQNFTDRQKKKASKKDAKGKDIGLSSYRLDDLILKDDGGVVLCGEQITITVITQTDARGNVKQSIRYYYGDLIAVSMGPDGSLQWNQKVAKAQISYDDGAYYSSYATAVHEDKIYFIFNDHAKNLFYKDDGEIYNFSRGKQGIVVLVEIDGNGEQQQREAIFSNRETDVITVPKVCEQITANEFVLIGERGKRHRLAKLTF